MIVWRLNVFVIWEDLCFLFMWLRGLGVYYLCKNCRNENWFFMVVC